MTVDRGVLAFARFVMPASIALPHFVHPAWIWLPVFAGANML